MKIAIVSDTHGNTANFKKAVNWLNINNISLILHAGDIGSPESLKESLADFKGEFLGVLGNMDKDYKILIKEYQSLKVRVVEEVLETEFGGNPSSSAGFGRARKIAITHKPEKARELAESNKYDLVFYGHTHRPWLARIATPARIAMRSIAVGRSIVSGEEKVGNCKMINPGELAGQINKPTFAIYDADTDKLELKILEKL